MGGPTNEADGGNFSAVSRKCSTLLELVVLNCSDDADPTAPGKELEEPSMVLCGSVPGLDVIGSSDDGSNSSSEDETSASCRISSDAESATSSSDTDIDDYKLGEFRNDPRTGSSSSPNLTASAAGKPDAD